MKPANKGAFSVICTLVLIPLLFHLSCLVSDIVSAGGQQFNMSHLDSLGLEKNRDINGQALDYTRNTSYYSHFIKGHLKVFQKLYDFDDPFFSESNIHDLPIQIHTGYLEGNGNTPDNGKPVKLNNLFLRYPDAKFVLFHGGCPWTGEYAALGKMFPNVYLDLAWLPRISREEAIHAIEVFRLEQRLGRKF